MRRLGIIAAPGWFEPSGAEILKRHAGEIAVTQTILGPPGFDWSFASIEQSESELLNAARLLVEAGSECVAQVGPAFAWVIGGSAAGARSLSQRLSAACGVPVVLQGTAVLDALAGLSGRRLAVACPYYSADWKQRFGQFLRDSGYRIDAFQTFVEQGIFPDQAAVAARQYDFRPADVKDSIRRTRAAAPQADAVVIGGSGVRTLNWIAELERELGLPLIAADRCLYRAAVTLLGVTPAA
jgi:maleate cis-trans isomerase